MKNKKNHTYTIASMMVGLLLLSFLFSIEYNSYFGLDYLFHYDDPYYYFINFIGEWLFIPITFMFGYFTIYDYIYKKKGMKTLKTDYPKKCPRCNDDLEKYVACELKCKSCGGIIDCSDDQ